MSIFAMVFLALVLDFILGEPKGLWERYTHPAILMGRAVNFFDERLNSGGMRKAKGILTIGILILIVLIPGMIVAKLNNIPLLGTLINLIEIGIATILIAHRSLIDHVREVATALQQGLADGQNAVSMIVGRDTGAMTESQVARAAIESAAENFSDGVIAPVFWFLLFGLPGILVYKIVNTADSMIGHRTEEYAEFGYAAAKLDDVMNWVPARLTAGLISLAYLSRDAMEMAIAEAPYHRSPNAGWPEAAMAGVLDVALAGPRSYEGEMTQDTFVNTEGAYDLGSYDILDAVQVLNRCWYIMAALFASLAFLIWIFF